jgi:hypothetical protein
MVTVSLHPFAFRKIVLLVAALIWFTSAVVFADPVFMNAHAREFASRSNRSDAAATAAFDARAVKSTDAPAVDARNAEANEVAPPAAAPPSSVPLDHLSTWNVQVVANPLTFWSMSGRL